MKFEYVEDWGAEHEENCVERVFDAEYCRRFWIDSFCFELRDKWDTDDGSRFMRALEELQEEFKRRGIDPRRLN